MITAAGAKSFFHQDKLGSVIAMTDASSGSPKGPFTYDPYGNCRVSGQDCGADDTVPYRYTGRRYDPETGLYYYRARYYSAPLGRFLQTDPIGYKDDINWYAYVGNDPTDKTDPTGLKMTCDNKNCHIEARTTPELAKDLVVYVGLTASATLSNLISLVNKQEEKADAGSQTDTRRSEPYVVRVQVQGVGVNGGDRSVTVSQSGPVKLTNVNLALTAMAKGLPKSEQKALGAAFVAASKWAKEAADGGGVSPNTHMTFDNGTDPAKVRRVDVETLSGETNIVH